MKRPGILRRGILAALLSAALLAPIAPVAPARAESDDPVETDGIGNLYSYSLCALGVAVSGVTMNIAAMIAALAYCRTLYREAL